MNGGQRPILRRGGPERESRSPEELEKARKEFMIRAINRELRKPQPEEIRLLGSLETIVCKGGTVTYTVRSESETFVLTSKDFQGLALASYIPDGNLAEVGCDAKLASIRAILAYLPKSAAKSPSRGQLTSIEFVPPDFRFVDAGPEEIPAEVIVEAAETELPPEAISGGNSKEDFETQRRNAMMSHIRGALRKPGAGEKQEMAFIEKTECNNKGIFFFVKTQTQTLKLSSSGEKKMEMKAFTPDVEHLQIGCGMKAVEIPAVITYTEMPDKRSKTSGELIALEFVPKSFVLMQ